MNSVGGIQFYPYRFKKGFGKLRNVSLMVTFFRWYWMGALVALLAGLDILFWLKRRKKQAKTV